MLCVMGDWWSQSWWRHQFFRFSSNSKRNSWGNCRSNWCRTWWSLGGLMLDHIVGWMDLSYVGCVSSLTTWKRTAQNRRLSGSLQEEAVPVSNQDNTRQTSDADCSEPCHRNTLYSRWRLLRTLEWRIHYQYELSQSPSLLTDSWVVVNGTKRKWDEVTWHKWTICQMLLSLLMTLPMRCISLLEPVLIGTNFKWI